MTDRLAELVKQLPDCIEPKMDLWPGIESRMRRRSARRACIYRLAVAAFVGAVGFGAYLGLRMHVAPSGHQITRIQTVQLPQHRPVEVIDQGLVSVNRTMEQIRAALQRNPSDQKLYGFLYATYRERNRLILERAKLTLVGSRSL